MLHHPERTTDNLLWMIWKPIISQNCMIYQPPNATFLFYLQQHNLLLLPFLTLCCYYFPSVTRTTQLGSIKLPKYIYNVLPFVRFLLFLLKNHPFVISKPNERQTLIHNNMFIEICESIGYS